MNNDEFRNRYDSLNRVTEKIDTDHEKSTYGNTIGRVVPLAEAVRRDIRNFMYTLALSSGSICEEEINFYSSITGGEDLLIAENDSSNDNFYNSMKTMISIENDLMKCGIIPYVADDNSPTVIYFRFFIDLGLEMLMCDKRISREEFEVYYNSLLKFGSLMIERLKKTDFADSLNIDISIGGDISAFDVLDYVRELQNKSPNNNTDNISKQPPTEEPQPDSSAVDAETKDESKLDELLSKLNSLTGLESIKQDVNSLINLIKIQKLRKQRGLKEIPVSLHMVFSGNPGTGKTTVARLLSEIYRELGVLSSGHLVEVDRSELVAGYVGQTAIKVQEVVDRAIGGILFIDEAYSLVRNGSDKDFGREAIDTLVKEMEDKRDNLIVIVAGYPDLMEEFIASNPGLRSRFNKYMNFPDYTPEELFSIFESLCEDNGYKMSDGCRERVIVHFTEIYNNRGVGFGNGRMVRNYFEKAVSNQANRLCTIDEVNDEELSTLEEEDVG